MFTAKPTIYSTPQSRVTYASSWFTGAAARYYQNLVEREQRMIPRYLAPLHEWEAFVEAFSRLFGLYDEKLQAQSTLDQTFQKPVEPFADFIVRFEDAALLTGYNDEAMRWRLLDQIRFDLRSRLTLVGRIPTTFEQVVERLLELDGAREIIKNTGLRNSTIPIRAYNPYRRPYNAQARIEAPPGPTTASVPVTSNANRRLSEHPKYQFKTFRGHCQSWDDWR
ncbi:hypothetical protein BT96DRAFT_1006525 [Gymnopus androsaceus JB14]|uniref:Retrotransposon gag domain-containing protein n=1 Tax=Gymnopus androsaceus JB14 TaxID=1447944 RepID=A0A6A4GKB6_9AGAR|nr:hypothetical protein BT96DRAFT_1006525 [Gymnopus androsaceus JB14]